VNVRRPVTQSLRLCPRLLTKGLWLAALLGTRPCCGVRPLVREVEVPGTHRMARSPSNASLARHSFIEMWGLAG
jgi:hypothetical protein